MTKKSLNMETLIVPKQLDLTAGEFTTEPVEVFLRIYRGPVTWQSKRYTVQPEDDKLVFSGEEFRKQSGFYFTKEGAEYKRMTIKIVKLHGEDTSEEEEELVSSDINLAALMRKEPFPVRIDFNRHGVLTLNCEAMVIPVEEKDMPYFNEYLEANKDNPNIAI